MINIVLFEPEIPFNTANIIRTCVGTNSKLHLIKPLGFDLQKDHKDLKRGSTNFLDDVDLTVYDNFEEFEKQKGDSRMYLLTRYGKEVYSDVEYSDLAEDVYILFGKESSGLPEYIMEKYSEYTLRIPMTEKMRSLNLSNCAALVTYGLLAKEGFSNLEKLEPNK